MLDNRKEKSEKEDNDDGTEREIDLKQTLKTRKQAERQRRTTKARVW